MSQWWDELFALHNQPMKYDLSRITSFLHQIGNPQHRFRSIHLVGTNGKGSTASFIKDMILAMGYRVGCYTSPHLYTPLERISIDHHLIDENWLRTWYSGHQPMIRDMGLSFFEIFTAAAFDYFADQGCQWAVCEAGLGGRLDATNVLAPEAVVITSISMDHQNVLGDTIESIVREKIAVIKPKIAVFLSRQSYPEVGRLTRDRCRELDCPLYTDDEHLRTHITGSHFDGMDFDLELDQEPVPNLHLNLAGEWQVENASMACLVVRTLFPESWNPALIRRALNTTQWSGRLQKITERPLIIADVSHNPDGLEKTLHFITRHQAELPQPVRIIFSVLARKDYRRMIELLRRSCLEIRLLPLSYSEGLTLSQLQDLKTELNLDWPIIPAIPYSDLTADPHATWLIIGSHYLLAETVPGILRHSHHLNVSAT
ncbi:MAG: hypothetical protein KBA26_11315 [Candidatus Delongbacteria bacterium]|nr:hypothetical protein [Candidatus Delongbacteria bacterium]